MNLVLCMAGLYQRFREAGYQTPKYLLPFRRKTVLAHVLDPLWSSGAFDRVLLVANRRDRAYRQQIAAILRARGLDEDDLLYVEDTRGQAETAEVAACALAADSRSADRPVVFHNVDTVLLHRDGQAIAAGLQRADGYIDVFESREPCYSYVTVDGRNQVTAIAEKQVISRWATSGLYGFASPAQYLREFDRIDISTKEPYISDVYRQMLSRRATIVTNNPAAREATIVLGTPDQYEAHRKQVA
ncbi:MAG: NTP transferase domain-containing protein [Planctomycetia bacterium]|nr:NTP transferase domain-containing protein [Planctomycetia bacterium]